MISATTLSAAQPGGADGAVRLRPGEPLVTVEKVRVSDSRAVRGFLGTPVDGSIVSWGYRGAICEYPDTGVERYDAGAGVDYAFNGNDGLHLTLADAAGFDLVVLRGGAKTNLYANKTELTEPRGEKPLHLFSGGAPTQQVRFPGRIAADRASFFGVRDGAIADVAFFRIHETAAGASTPQWQYLDALPPALPPPTSRFAAESILQAMPERYPDKNATVFGLGAASSRPASIPCRASVPVHFVTSPRGARSGLDAVQFDLVIGGAPGAFNLAAVVQDPLDPRLDLAWVDFSCAGNGRYRFRLDIPDQVLFEASRLWVTLIFDHDVTLTGADGNAPRLGLEAIPVAQALPEAIAHRKFLLKSFFAILSETRPWGGYRQQSREEYFAGVAKHGGMGRFMSELFLTLDICHDLAPADGMVRQYREWVYLRNLDRLSEVVPPPEPPAGVPAWAWYSRLGWLEVRRIAEWWLDERLVPTGEFGGMVGDDSDLYQQFADLPNFEDSGVAARLKAAAARLAELADRKHLRGGINLLTTDALHAYEEGMNHLALMARWYYGDPVYFERCLESAASMENLTLKTADGRRHIPHSREIGFRDLEDPRPPTIDGGANPLLWHPTLQAIEYNRNPRALALVREWADTWLHYQRPGQWATDIDVQSGEVKASSAQRPLDGKGQDLTFTWLYRLTREAKYIEPFLHFYRRGAAPSPANEFLHDLYNLGALDGIDAATLKKLQAHNPALQCLLTRDASGLVQAIIGSPKPAGSGINSLYDARRWPDMYTKTHLYNDRVFLHLSRHPATAYLGGFSYRTRYLPANAVSWEGFGTDYGALVTVNRPNRLEASIYNFLDRPLTGTMRIWALQHGIYRVETGTDADHDNKMDALLTTTERQLARADGVPIALAPRSTTVVRITQIKELDDITARADLALAAREIELKDGTVSGVVHNIGTKPADQVIIGIIDGHGKLRARAELGALAAPNDLKPKRMPFTIRLPAEPERNWKIALDPENALPEIFEGNNTVTFGELTAARDASSP